MRSPKQETRASAAWRRQTALRSKINEIGKDGIKNQDDHVSTETGQLQIR